MRTVLLSLAIGLALATTPAAAQDKPGGLKTLFNGKNLDGWKTEKGAWTVADGVLQCTGKADLRFARKVGQCVLSFDAKRPASSDGKYTWVVADHALLVKGKPGDWQQESITIRGSSQVSFAFKAMEGLEIRNVRIRELEK